MIFEPQRKIKLSRSTYKVTSYVDFKPYKQSFKQFGQYIGKFLINLHNPNYVSTLYNMDRPRGEPPIRRGAGAKQLFAEASCKQTTYRCRMQNQFLQLKRGATKINQIFLETYKKFLRAIDHMEFHPTLGRAKTGSTIRLKRQPKNKDKTIKALSSKQVNPLIIPPDALRGALAQIKKDMKRNPRLQLPEDPNINIWNYYPIMKVTPIVMDDFLLIILTIPLTDQSLEMDLYKIYNLPALHPELKVEFTYELEGEYLAITKNKLYAALPTAREIRICKGTGGYLCLMNQALYPIDKIEWCTYALFTHDEKKKRDYCSINTHKRDANKAQSLEGYLWAVTAFEKGKMQIRCMTDTHVIDIKPPLTIIYMGDGCEAYSNNLFIPAKSELTSTDSSLVRHSSFQKFNEEYQDITRYSLIEYLGIVQLTPKEIAKIPDRLTALPKLQFKELKRRLVEIKQPLNIHSNVSFILVMIGGFVLCPIIAYVLWRIYRVHSNIKGFKPMVKIFNDKKGGIFNISDLVSNRL